MANDCWNKVIIHGDEDKLKKLYSKFTSSSDGVFNLSNYRTLFESADLSDMTDDDDWGSKRFTPECELLEGELRIWGDSAWTPMEGLFETISFEWGVKCVLEYEERGCDFAGKLVWNAHGVLEEFNEWTYWEKLLITDPDNFWEEMTWRNDIYETFEEMVEDFNLDKWKDSTILDMDKLKDIWDEYCG